MLLFYQLKGSRDSSVDTVTGYGLYDRGSILRRQMIFSIFQGVHTDTGTHPSSYGMHIDSSFVWSKNSKRTKLTAHIVTSASPQLQLVAGSADGGAT
jgi:hypothetical protein